MPLQKLGGKEYYLGIFFKVKIIIFLLNVKLSNHTHKSKDEKNGIFAGQLVQGGAVLQVPQHAPGQHQQRGGAAGAGGGARDRVQKNFNWEGQDPFPFTPLIQIVTHNIYLSQEHITGFGMGNEHFWSSGTDQGEESK